MPSSDGKNGGLEDSRLGDRLHIVAVLEATVGGTRTHVLHLLEGLDPQRFRRTLIASAERDAGFRREFRRLRESGINVIEVPMVRRIAPWRDLTALARLWLTLRRLDADIVHTHASKAGMMGRLAARLARSRHILHTPHAYFFQGKSGLSHWFFRTLERLALPLTDGTILLSESQRRLAVEELRAEPARLEVIENAVDTSHFAPRDGKSEARKALGLPPEAPVAGAIARLVPQKACDVFLEAMALVRKELPSCYCVLVGDGPLRDEVDRLADRLGLSDRLIRRDVAEDPRTIYEALDLFVLSSRYEGMPYVLLEAMSMGLPVVATNVTGSRDVVEDGVTGLLSPPDRPEELARRIVQMLRDPERARRMGQEGRRRVVEKFPLERFVERMTAIYYRQARSG